MAVHSIREAAPRIARTLHVASICVHQEHPFGGRRRCERLTRDDLAHTMDGCTIARWRDWTGSRGPEGIPRRARPGRMSDDEPRVASNRSGQPPRMHACTHALGCGVATEARGVSMGCWPLVMNACTHCEPTMRVRPASPMHACTHGWSMAWVPSRAATRPRPVGGSRRRAG